MMAHKMGITSKKVYDTLHKDFQTIIDWGLKKCVVDFSMYEGHRPVEKQLEYYKKGRGINHTTGEWEILNEKKVITNIDGIRVKGKHNYSPSLALDMRAFIPDKPQLTWDVKHLTYIAASLIMIAEFLYDDGIIQHKLRWGGNWRMDGDLSNESLYDLPHLELYMPK